MIETFIPLHGAGTHYFTGSTEYYDMLWGPFFPGAIHGITLLISDTIIIETPFNEHIDEIRKESIIKYRNFHFFYWTSI